MEGNAGGSSNNSSDFVSSRRRRRSLPSHSVLMFRIGSQALQVSLMLVARIIARCLTDFSRMLESPQDESVVRWGNEGDSFVVLEVGNSSKSARIRDPAVDHGAEREVHQTHITQALQAQQLCQFRSTAEQVRLSQSAPQQRRQRTVTVRPWCMFCAATPCTTR